MSDTCPTAEKTKRLLSEIIKEQATEMAREKMGDAWDGLWVRRADLSSPLATEPGCT